MGIAKDHLNISLLDAVYIKEPCFVCTEQLEPEDIWVIGVYVPRQKVIYFHDDSCFDQFLGGLNIFDSVRDKMRNSGPELRN